MMIVCAEHERQLPWWAKHIVDKPEYGDSCEPCRDDTTYESMRCVWLPVRSICWEKTETGDTIPAGLETIGDWVCADGLCLFSAPDRTMLPNEYFDAVDNVQALEAATAAAKLHGEDGIEFEYNGERVMIA